MDVRATAVALLSWGLLLAGPWPGRAETIWLRTGGRVEGKLVATGPADTAVPRSIELVRGGRLVLDEDQIASIDKLSDAEAHYRRRAPRVPRTVEAQWRLAEWCRENGLTAQRRVHLEQILKLDGNHVGARRGLGYFQYHGQWVTRAEVHQRAGYVRHEGRWRTPQDVRLLEEREAWRQARVEWQKRLQRWRQQIARGKPHEIEEAWQQIQKIADPAAIGPLADLVRQEPLLRLKRLYIRQLAAIPHPSAVQHLVQLSLTEAHPEVVDDCLQAVVGRRLPDTLETYAQFLRDADNYRVNRAAQALRRFREPATLAPLIEALITPHAIPLGPTPGGTHTVSLLRPADGNSGGDIAFKHDSNPPAVTILVPNREVLAALVDISGGVSFGYDQAAWRRWLAAQRQRLPTVTNLRSAPEAAPQ